MKTYTVTIGITAYNEGSVIQRLLQSLITQKEHRIKIETIMVLDDQSTDDTVKKTKEIPDTRIVVKEFPSRMGKTGRVNDAYRLNTSDILILLDADCICADEYTIEEFCRPFIDDPSTMLVGGNSRCFPPTSIIGRGMNNLMEAYDIVRRELHNGDNIYSCRGLNFAIRKSFADTIHLPADVPFDDNYTFLACKQRGYRYRFAHTSYVLYRTPQTVSDQIRQGTRFQSNVIVLSQHFDPTFVSDAFAIPLSFRIRMLLYQVKKNPFAWLCIKIIGVYCYWKSRKTAKDIKGVWQQVARS